MSMSAEAISATVATSRRRLQMNGEDVAQGLREMGEDYRRLSVAYNAMAARVEGNA